MGLQPKPNRPLTPEELLQQNMQNAALEVEQQFVMGRPLAVAAPANDAPLDLEEQSRIAEVVGKPTGEMRGDTPVYSGGLPTGSQGPEFYDQGNWAAGGVFNNRIRRLLDITSTPFQGEDFYAYTKFRDKMAEPVDKPLWSTRDEYERLLPQQVRQSMARRREGGYDVPFRPVPDHVIDFWRKQGPRLTQAQIQWGYAQRDRAERNGWRPGQPARQRPMTRQEIAAEFPVDPRNGQPWAPGHEPLGGIENIARRNDDLGARARALIEERDRRLAEDAAPVAQAPDAAAEPAAQEGLIDEAQAIENNNAARVRGIREGLHPQQDMNLGGAEEQNRWNEFVGQSVDRMNRYQPGALVPEIDAPNWRELEAEFDAQALEGEFTPEEIEQKKQGFNTYFAAENNRRAREIALRFGGSMTEETVQNLMAASAPVLVNRYESQAEARKELQNQSDALTAIERTGRFYDRIGRARNLTDRRQNQRFVGIANDPNESAGFAFRTMATGTPEERSAFAFATGNPLAYTTEMEQGRASQAAPPAGGQNQNPRPQPVDEMIDAEAVQRNSQIVDAQIANGDYQLAQGAAVALTAGSGLTTGDVVVLRMLTASRRARSGEGGIDHTATDSGRAYMAPILAAKAAEGYDAFFAFVSQAGVSADEAQQLFNQFSARQQQPATTQPSAAVNPRNRL